MISPADLAGYQAKAAGKRIPAGMTSKRGAPISAPEEQLAWQLTGAGIKYLRNVPFHPRRKWTADFMLLPQSGKPVLLVEVEGKGRHQQHVGFENDCHKYAEAMMMGYIVLRVTPRQITEQKALKWIQRLLGSQTHTIASTADDRQTVKG